MATGGIECNGGGWGSKCSSCKGCGGGVLIVVGFLIGLGLMGYGCVKRRIMEYGWGRRDLGVLRRGLGATGRGRSLQHFGE